MSLTQDAAAVSVRAKRARKDRPCDECRRLKQTCVIATRDEPCAFCRRKSRSCTFATPPTARKRRPRPEALADGDPPGDDASFSADMFDLASPGPSRSASGFSLARLTSRLRDEVDSTAAASDSASSDSDEYFDSLDLETADTDHHYLGSGAIVDHFGPVANPGVEKTFEDIGISFRQLSKDTSKPVYFMHNPSLLYGRVSDGSGKDAYTKITALLDGVETGWPDKLFNIYLDRTLPAMPIMNRVRLEAACMSWGGGGPFPYALMAGIMAHSVVHVPALRHLHRPIWGHVLTLLDDEYRQPRLRVLQLAMIDFLARPNSNHGGNFIALARSTGLARLLGLHVNCSRWKLPKWERSVRKRLWWNLFIHDKWSSLIYGRPACIAHDSHDVPLPTIDDDDWGGEVVTANDSMQSFIDMCRLSCIVERALDGMSMAAATRAELVHALARELDELERAAPSSSAPGVASMKLSHLAVCMLVTRLALDNVESAAPRKFRSAIDAAYEVILRVVEFAERLGPADCSAFWLPYSSYQLSTAMSMLLRVALHAARGPVSGQPDLVPYRSKAYAAAQRLLVALRAAQLTHSWEVAEGALHRAQMLIRSVCSELPEFAQLLDAPPAQLSAAEPAPQADSGFLFSADGILNDAAWLNGDVDLILSSFNWADASAP